MNTFKNLLVSSCCPLVVELRTVFKPKNLKKIKGSCTVKRILTNSAHTNQFSAY